MTEERDGMLELHSQDRNRPLKVALMYRVKLYCHPGLLGAIGDSDQIGLVWRPDCEKICLENKAQKSLIPLQYLTSPGSLGITQKQVS